MCLHIYDTFLGIPEWSDLGNLPLGLAAPTLSAADRYTLSLKMPPPKRDQVGFGTGLSIKFVLGHELYLFIERQCGPVRF